MTLLAGWVAAAVHAAPAPSPEALVADAARRVLLEQVERDGLLAPEVEISVLPSAGAAPVCATPFEVETVDTRFASRMRFALRCPDSAAPARPYVVRGRVSAEVVIAVAGVPAGRPIGAAELALDRRDITATPDALSDIEAAVGRASQRPLRAGQVLQKRLLVEATLVKRGDTVQIEARRGPVHVSASGEALEAGRRGDIVRVRNTSTAKVIRARVVEAGVVEPADMN